MVTRNVNKLKFAIVKPIPIRLDTLSPWYTERLSWLYFWEIGFEWLPTDKHTHIAWWCNIFSTVTLRWLTVFIVIPVMACVYACVCVCEEKEREKREEYVLRKLKCWGNNKREKLHLMPEVTESISIFG